LAVFALILALAAAPAAVPCVYDKDALLALSFDDFDQAPGGWRALAPRTECGAAIPELLANYRAKHWGMMNSQELHLNYWHEGQMRALNGQTDRAVTLLLAGTWPESTGDFTDYALGTVAFLHHDLAALKAARARLAQLTPPADLESRRQAFKARFKVDMVWPPNIDVLDGLINCFDRPYREAYDRACRAPAAH
jgi:hypothetical protein